MTIAFASIFAFAQTENKAVVQQTQTTAQTDKADANVTPARVKNNTSLGVNYAGAGMSLTFVDGTNGMTGYVEGNYNVFKNNTEKFAVDIYGNVSYSDISVQNFGFDVSVIPSYNVYTCPCGADVKVFTDVGIGYGSTWFGSTRDDLKSSLTYHVGAGVELSYNIVYLKPYYSYMNIEPFNSYDTISFNQLGIEAGVAVTEKVDVIGGYYRSFADTKYIDDEDVIFAGIRYKF